MSGRNDSKSFQHIQDRFIGEVGRRFHWKPQNCCDVLQVSRSGFYAWHHHKDAPRTPNKLNVSSEWSPLKRRSKTVAKFYGYRKLHAALQRQGVACSPNTVHTDCQSVKLKVQMENHFELCPYAGTMLLAKVGSAN
jgi:hypothetical protein